MGARTHHAMSFMTLIFLLVCMATAAEPLAAQGALHAKPVPKAEGPSDIVRDPSDVPPPIANRAPTVVHVTLTTQEVFGQLDPSTATSYHYWTFGGKVPGPMIRVRQGDTVEVTLHNDNGSHMVHSVDFHAALGPGGGAAFSQVVPGQTKIFTFQATTPGLFFYHCGTPMVAEHIANGMYGLILVEPEGGLPHVDHEYYVMQGEIYTTAPKGKTGLQQYSNAKLMDEMPEYFVFNGAVDSLTKKYSLHANVGETIRLFFGDARPQCRFLSARGRRNLHSRLCIGFTDVTSTRRGSNGQRAAGQRSYSRTYGECAGAVHHGGPRHGTDGQRLECNTRGYWRGEF